MTKKTYSEKDVAKELNDFFMEEFDLKKDDYYAKLDINGVLRLKNVLSNINNILTKKLSVAFAELVTEKLSLPKTVKDEMIAEIQKRSANANGYDIKVSEPVKIIAEVKCNIPINGGTVYGSAFIRK